MVPRIGLALLLPAALVAACGEPPKVTAVGAQVAAGLVDRPPKAEAARLQKQDEEFKKRIQDTGSISLEASDQLIAQLDGADPQARAQAAIALANANGKRAVEPIMKALRSESDEQTYVTFIVVLDHLSDMRAVHAFVDALRQPGISDKSREHALRSILRYRAGERFVPQIRAFFDSLTDPQIRARVEPALKELEK